MCERQFGSFTNIRDWWSCGRVSYKVVHSVLSHFANLIGFWRGVGNGSHGSLVVFEWHSYKIVGYRIIPARLASYKVHKVPFVEIGWIGVSQKEMPVCLLDPDWAQLVPGLVDGENTRNGVNGSTLSQPLQIPISPQSAARKGASNPQGRDSPFEALGPDWTLEDPTPTGLVVVDLHFVGSEHVVLEEYQQAIFSGYPFSGRKTLVEAAALASFGSSENLCPAGGSPGRHSSPSSGGGSEAGKSPPGSFPYEMYHYLAKKVTSPGGERAARKQRRRDRERALNQGRHRYESEHFVKIPHFCPTKEQPLQGLWKGIGRSTGLDFVALSYDDHGGIICRKVGDYSGMTRSGSVCWTARAGHGMSAPLPDSERQIFELRQHMLPSTSEPRVHGVGLMSDDFLNEEVVEMLWATVEVEPGLNYNVGVEDATQSRVWHYASGRFGFGNGPDGRVVDFRPICIKDSLVDVVELRSRLT
ncbi:hypothetical protein KC19_7G130100 [Ceratodon purpureus]|nr:hypothetical protein KC19_7G130100 [Ceratodon purpureus]